MKEKFHEISRRIKEEKERGKEIRSLRTKREKIIKIVLPSVAIIMLLIFMIGAYLEFYPFAGITFFILLCYSWSCAYFTNRIDKRTLKEYRDNYVLELLEFCPHCGEKIEQQTNYCENCGKQTNQKVSQSDENQYLSEQIKWQVEGKEYEESLKLLPETLEVANISRKGVFFSLFITGIICSTLFSTLFSFLFETKSNINILQTFLQFTIIFTIAMFFMGLFVDFFTLHAKFRISHEGLEIYLENHLYFKVKWHEIKIINFYRVTFQGYFIKIDFGDSFKLIPFKILQFSKKKREKIFNTIAGFSTSKGIKISREEKLKPILEERGRTLLHGEIEKFSRKHKYKRAPTIML